MSKFATKERKRALRAAPSPRGGVPLGCVAALGLYLGVCLALLALTNHALFLALAVPGLIVVGYGLIRYIYGLGLLLVVQIKWSSRGIRCVLVHSDSPIWEARIRNTWLPRFGPSVDTQNRPLMDS